MLPPPLPPAHVRTDAAIAAQAERLCRLPMEQADAICDDQIARAVRQWRIADATEWQRVKFRHRWMRAMRARGAGGKAGA